MYRLLCALLLLLTSASAAAQGPPDRPVRVAVARLTHGHVGGLLGRRARGDVEIVGIYEPDRAVAARYIRQFALDPALVHDRLAPMLDKVKPDAVVAFGSIAEHRAVVEAAAPRRLHVMVEKPLAFSTADANAMAALARRHGVQLLTNYETTWYPSRTALKTAPARCFTRAHARQHRPVSGRRWIKGGGHVTGTEIVPSRLAEIDELCYRMLDVDRARDEVLEPVS